MPKPALASPPVVEVIAVLKEELTPAVSNVAVTPLLTDKERLKSKELVILRVPLPVKERPAVPMLFKLPIEIVPASICVPPE
ncbi:hypothetical protein OY671_012192 [Metschnikowia pulcherrima]|nr:hypothetical protein OY671_012192 [Metschnikowia pulcherrima]